MPHPLYIAFIWHMHQPYYRDLLTGDCPMPWVRLHGTKDYLDMVKILEPFPALHQTFNLVPSLIDQLQEYEPPASRSDYFLDLSRKPAAQLTDAEKRFILEWFFMANWDHMVKPYPRYHDLLAKRGWSVREQAWPEVVRRFRTQDYLDVQVWFNLAWIDPWLRQQDQALAALEAKGSQFSEEEKRLVLDKHLAILQQIVPAYRQAQERGQVELTTSPYYHPIVPLLCDVRRAHAALPRLPLPEGGFRHPEDARWHLSNGVARHTALFGRAPEGLWPPEGSVSEELVQLAMDAGLRWIATDEEILWRTLKTSRSPSLLYQPHRLHRKDKNLAIVFRDRELSDLIGFVYSQWTASMAVQDFVNRCGGIYEQFRAMNRPALVSVILDGENAWECYPRDGHDFFQGLYRTLAQDARFRLVTVSEYLRQFPVDQQPSLPELFTGSWIDGNFATWVGHPEKNAAWTHLARAREALAAHPAKGGREALELAWRSLYIAEGSDWMWWYGDTHSSAQDEEFDRLFRAHTANVYRGLGQEVPPALHLPIKVKTINPTYEPTALLHPTIDGQETSYYEWIYAGYLDLRKGYASAHRGQQLLRALYYGFDQTHYYFRIDVDAPGLTRLDRWGIHVTVPNRSVTITISGHSGQGATATLKGKTSKHLPCAFRKILEFAVPKTAVVAAPGDPFQFRVTLSHNDEPLESYPAHGSFRLLAPPEDFEAYAWSV